MNEKKKIILADASEEFRQMLAELWDRDVCRELADIRETRRFPCTQAGLDEMKAYLLEATSG